MTYGFWFAGFGFANQPLTLFAETLIYIFVIILTYLFRSAVLHAVLYFIRYLNFFSNDTYMHIMNPDSGLESNTKPSSRKQSHYRLQQPANRNT